MTDSALCAKAIRKELKAAFPGVTFSIRSENFAGGNAVRINYTNSVPREEVEKITRKYQYGHFDGMIDLYENSNQREDIPQAKYVQVQRHITNDQYEIAKLEVAKRYGIQDPTDNMEWHRVCGAWDTSMVHRELVNKALPNV